MKHITLFLLLLCLFNFTAGEKRRKPKTLEQLSEPSALYYVPPHPYPQTRPQILKNLEFGVRRDYHLRIRKNLMPGKYPPRRSLLLDFFDGKTSLEIGKILRVKNRYSSFAHDHSFLILFMNDNRQLIECVAYIDAIGLFRGAKEAAGPWANGIQNLLLSRNDIMKMLSQETGLNIKQEHVKQMERLKVNRYLAHNTYIWEISLKDGTYYYYSLMKEVFYTIDERIPWKKDKNGKRKDLNMLAPYNRLIADSINDEIIVLSVLKRKSRER